MSAQLSRKQARRSPAAHLSLALVAVIGFSLIRAPEASAIAQRVGDFELALDAPWRMEPRPAAEEYCDPAMGCMAATYDYDPIPIQISIHDAYLPNDDDSSTLQFLINTLQRPIGTTGASLPAVVWAYVKGAVTSQFGWAVRIIEGLLGADLGLPVSMSEHLALQIVRFDTLRIAEEIDGRFVDRRVYRIDDLHEVERTEGIWHWSPPGAPPRTRPDYTLCRVWAGDDCSAMDDLRDTSEWHATAFYTPIHANPGEDVRLRLSLHTDAREGGLPRDKVFRHFVNVHLGEAPLPRFEGGVYGDLHYHSQGTDNDGESAYSYRGVLQAMAAMGMDFAFATDHASNSPQIASGGVELSPALLEPEFRGLRDLSPDRFAFHLGLLNGPGGANEEVLSASHATSAFAPTPAPQLFLGSEVDVIPEFDLARPPAYAYKSACQEVFWLMKIFDLLVDPLELLANVPWNPTKDDIGFLNTADVCGDGETMRTMAPDGRALVRDVQGPHNLRFLSKNFFGRQHLLHLPVDPHRADAFIPSNTSKYGGATRRLGEILDEELDARQKGYVFLAHPMSKASGHDIGRAGPDLVPYSDAQLRDAFESPYVLGLQLWNENGQRSTSMKSGGSTAADGRLVPVADGERWIHEKQRARHLFDEMQLWDVQQLRGIDPDATRGLDWLASDEPRRIFLAGGSDAHGDLNYRRTGYFVGTDGVNDTALGTPRNLVFPGSPEGDSVSGPGGHATPHSQEQVVDALRAGHFSVTDGPAVRIAYDTNRNGVIDEGDGPMGSVNDANGCTLPFVVEWKSSPEFGPVDYVMLSLGVDADEHDQGIVYQGLLRGGEPAGGSDEFEDIASGESLVRTPSIPYWYDPTRSKLFIEVAAYEGYEGRRSLRLDPADFPVGRDRAVCEDEYEELVAALDEDDAPFGSLSTTVASTSYQLVDASPSLDSDYSVYAGTSPTTWTNTSYPSNELGTTALQTSPAGFGSSGTFDFEITPVPPLSDCDRVQIFDEPVLPQRLFLRAEAVNELAPESIPGCEVWPDSDRQCFRRKAYTNPVWVRYSPVARNTCVSLEDWGGGLPYTQAPTADTGEPNDPSPQTVETPAFSLEPQVVEAPNFSLESQVIETPDFSLEPQDVETSDFSLEPQDVGTPDFSLGSLVGFGWFW